MSDICDTVLKCLQQITTAPSKPLTISIPTWVGSVVVIVALAVVVQIAVNFHRYYTTSRQASGVYNRPEALPLLPLP